MSKQTTPDAFARWIAREMPAGTTIGDPAWWAPRLWRAAEAARRDAAWPEGVECGGKPQPCVVHPWGAFILSDETVCPACGITYGEYRAARDTAREAREAAERAANENKRHYEVAFSHVQNERRRADSAEARVRELEAWAGRLESALLSLSRGQRAGLTVTEWNTIYAHGDAARQASEVDA